MSSVSRNLIIEEKSFVPCEELKYGRISFKGFNPEVEVCSLGRLFALMLLSGPSGYFDVCEICPVNNRERFSLRSVNTSCDSAALTPDLLAVFVMFTDVH